MLKSNPYDVNQIFAEMEADLTKSYKRNIAKHTEQEVKDGFKWDMWQAQKLRDMKQYQAENRAIVDRHTKRAKEAATGAIKDSFAAGRDTADALLKGGIDSTISSAESFGIMNRRKVDALLQAANDDLNKANAATLRLTDDAYRQIVFKSQVMHAAGGATLKQAVDRASKDFLENGINAIIYKNGARVNVASYAEMAIRNSSKKAYLVGEGARQAEWGVDLVQVTSYGACSELCLPWQGRVYVDDVFAGGKKGSGDYPLLSSAMAEGLYHPNCRHTQGAYFEGISFPPPPSNVKEIQENYAAEQRQRAIERNIRKYKRVADGSLDPENQKRAETKVRAWQGEMRQHLLDNPQLSRKYINEKTYGIPVNPDKVVVPKVFGVKELEEKYGIKITQEKDVVLHPDVFKSMDESFARINSRMPDGYKVKDVLDEIEMRNYRESSSETGSASSRHMNINARKLDPRNFKTEEDLLSSYNSKIARGSAKNMSPTSTVTHEMGHLIHDKLLLDTKGVHKETLLKTQNTNIRKEVLDKFGLTAKNSDAYKLGKELSDYAATSPHEFFAEAFMESIDNPNPREMSKEFWKVLMGKLK